MWGGPLAPTLTARADGSAEEGRQLGSAVVMRMQRISTPAAHLMMSGARAEECTHHCLGDARLDGVHGGHREQIQRAAHVRLGHRGLQATPYGISTCISAVCHDMQQQAYAECCTTPARPPHQQRPLMA